MFRVRVIKAPQAVPLSFNLWPWENNSEDSLRFFVQLTGVDPSGIQSVEKSVAFEMRESPRVMGVPLDYQPPGPGTALPRPWPPPASSSTTTPSPHYLEGKSGPPLNLGYLESQVTSYMLCGLYRSLVAASIMLVATAGIA